MSSFKVAELVLALGNLGLAGTVFPAVSSSLCAIFLPGLEFGLVKGKILSNVFAWFDWSQ